MTDPAGDAGPGVEAVLFDLDGTLADTLPGLAAALASVAGRRGGVRLPHASLRALVNRGARAMVRAAFPDVDDPRRFDTLHAEFLDHYAADLDRPAALFDGIEAVIGALVTDGRRWGIVTNKLARFTEPLVRSLALTHPPGCVVSGDSAAAAKPDPAPLRLACERLRVAPAAAVYVGDARTDVVAAHACGMRAVAAGWGYLPPSDDPRQWEADHVAGRPEDVTGWLRSPAAGGPRRPTGAARGRRV